MCSELFRIPVEWGGVPIFGIGVLLAAWLVGGGLFIVLACRQPGARAEVLSYLPGLIIGAAAIVLIPRLFPDGLPIRGYGVMVLTGSIVGLWLASIRARQADLDPETIYSLALGMFLCGIVGARLFYVIEYWESRFQLSSWSETLVAVLKFTEGGLVVYGALIGATLAFGFFVWRRNLSPLAMADLIAPSLMAGLAFGRIGCLLNGCCYGGETTLPWAVTFPQDSSAYMEQISDGSLFGLQLGPYSADDSRPVIVAVEADSAAHQAGLKEGTLVTVVNDKAVLDIFEFRDAVLLASNEGRMLRIRNSSEENFKLVIEAPARSRPVHPTQVYSAVQAGLLAWVLWSFFPFRRRDGEVIALMLTVYPISRFLLEMIRVDEQAVFGTGLSISQNISIGILLLVAGLWIYLLRQSGNQITSKSATA